MPLSCLRLEQPERFTQGNNKRELLKSTSMDHERRNRRRTGKRNEREKETKQKREGRERKELNKQTVRGERGRIRKARQAGWRKERHKTFTNGSSTS